jgi:hypothetical protein
MSSSNDCWCCDCAFALDPFAFYRKQAAYTPGKMYYKRFQVPLKELQADRPRTVMYHLQPYETTRDALRMHLSQCCPVHNFDLQFRQDNIEGMEYISQVRGVPLPPIVGNTQLVPLPERVYDSHLYPPMANTAHVQDWINGSLYYNERVPLQPGRVPVSNMDLTR